MRHLAQMDVVERAAGAAVLTALLCYPRLMLWQHRLQPIWYMESMVFVVSFVLWGGVFAWHSRYSTRPAFTVQIEMKTWIETTAAALIVAVLLHLWLDPSMRRSVPADYPSDLKQWLAMTLFHLAFVQLVLVFAPFAWSIRLFRDMRIATGVTVGIGVLVLTLKVSSSLHPVPAALLAVLAVLRIILGLLSVSFYLRGGVILVWWWSFIIEARHLLNMPVPAQ